MTAGAGMSAWSAATAFEGDAPRGRGRPRRATSFMAPERGAPR